MVIADDHPLYRTGLLDTVKGENLEVDGLARTAEVYARAAMRVCGVAE